MDLGLEGKNAAVAAGSAGLGLASAKALAAEGARVAICGRDGERLAGRGGGDRGRRDPPGRRRGNGRGQPRRSSPRRSGGWARWTSWWRTAAAPRPGNFASTDIEAYRTANELAMLGSIAMCRAAIPAMQERGWGRVVAITSFGVRQPPPQLIASATARAGLTAFLKVTAREVAKDGVTVNSVQPGAHDTARLRGNNADLGAIARSLPTGVIGDAGDFGQAVAFLCSQQARFITGAALLVDGGASLGV